MLEKFERAVDGDAVDIGINLLRDVENLSSIHVASGRLHHLDHNETLPSQANAARFQFTLEMARGFIDVDAFAG